MSSTIRFEPERAYLEMARAALPVAILKPNLPESAEEPDWSSLSATPNTLLAILAQSYVFSYMAVTAWANKQIGVLWKEADRPIQKLYPEANSLGELLNRELKQLKDVLKAISEVHNIKPLHEAEPRIWNDLLQVVERVRHFLTHPVLNQDEFDEIVGEAGTRRSWEFPSTVAEKTIAYFYDANGYPVPDWVHENQEFTIEGFRPLSFFDPGEHFS